VAAGAVIAFVGGLIAGSFVSAVAYRVPRGISIVAPRSMCTNCGTQIAAYDNVPVISWLALRGRSRCCHEPISLRYPLTELALGALFVATTLVLWDQPAELALGLVFLTTLAAVTLTDLERRIIPNRILLVSALIGVLIAAAAEPSSLPERAISAAAAGGLLSGSIVGVVLIVRHGAEARKRALPFGPFLALGGVVGLLAGDPIVDWYLNSFT
jgi:leader peptidase (prepilin peptidase) / N-methyltransferase